MDLISVSITVWVRMVESPIILCVRCDSVTDRENNSILMTEEQINQWLTDFSIRLVFKQSFTRDELKEMFDMYNLLTMEHKPVTSCSSCVASVISRLKAECRMRKIM